MGRMRDGGCSGLKLGNAGLKRWATRSRARFESTANDLDL